MSRTDAIPIHAFIAAIPGSGGIKSIIAQRLKVEWHTVDRYIKKYPTIARAYEDEKAAVDDKARSNVFDAISRGDLETSKWWLRVKLPDEFAPREDFTSKGKALVNIIEVVRDDSDSGEDAA